jgi:hypothetical protein
MVDAKRKTFGWLFPTDSCECVRDRLGFCGTLALICAVLLPSSQLALAQFTQQGPKLVGTGGDNAAQGSSVALSGDGNTAIVGGPSDNSNAGAAWVFTRSSSGIWTQQGAKLVGTGAVGNANQGLSVALSGDGNTAIVGGYTDNDNIGAAWVYTRSGGVWAQQGSKLVGTGAVGQAWQGWSVALSGDGNTAIVGGNNDSSTIGAAWVYTRSGGVWTQQGGKLVGQGPNYQEGQSVALSGDGNTAIVGNPYGSTAAAAWVFTRSNGVWTQQGGGLVATDAIGVRQRELFNIQRAELAYAFFGLGYCYFIRNDRYVHGKFKRERPHAQYLRQ